MNQNTGKRGLGLGSIGSLALFSHWQEAASIAMRIAYGGLAFLLTVLLARQLDPVELGRYFEIMAWVLLIGAMVQTGWSPFLVREVASLKEQKKHGQLVGIGWLAIRLVGVASIPATLGMIAVAYLAGTRSPAMTTVWIGAAVIPILSIGSLKQAITRGMGRTLQGQICGTLALPGLQVVLLFCWWLGLFGRSLSSSTAMATFLIATTISTAFAFVLERRATVRVRKRARRRLPPMEEWIGSLTRNALIGWSTAVNLQVGTIVLGSLGEDSHVAIFKIAQQLSLLMALGLTAIVTLYAPDLSRCFARKDPRAMQALATKGALFSFMAALPLAIAFIGFGKELVRLFFGPSYASSYPSLVVMSLGQLANAGFGLVTVIAVAARSEAAALRAHILSAACNVLLCVLLVPWLGATGAAVASSFSLTLWNMLLYIHLRRKFSIHSFFAPSILVWRRAAPAAEDDLE